MARKIKNVLFIVLIFFSWDTKSQIPDPALIGYWHNWNDPSAPFIQLDQVDSRYNLVNLAFAVPQPGTDYQMEFIPDQVSKSILISQIQSVQAAGRKVSISIGGASSPVSLDNSLERDTFIQSMNRIINEYNFDGIDIDLEGASLSVSGGTLSSPVDSPVINLIFAVKKIMENYYTMHNKRLLLTLAPETAFVQGGMSSYGSIWGAYLPVLDALRDSIEILSVQLYNSGSMTGIDGHNYSQATADFIIAMTEAVIQGFSTGGGFFNGLPAHKIAVGLPACPAAAGGGFTDTAVVQSAINYLRGISSTPPGNYSLAHAGGYPDLRGMMTWSVNWDATSTCENAYQFADNYTVLFGSVNSAVEYTNDQPTFNIYPNPSSDFIWIYSNEIFTSDLKIEIYNFFGYPVFSGFLHDKINKTDIRFLSSGTYLMKLGNKIKLFVKN